MVSCTVGTSPRYQGELAIDTFEHILWLQIISNVMQVCLKAKFSFVSFMMLQLLCEC